MGCYNATVFNASRDAVWGAFHEALHEIDHDGRRLEFSIDDGPGPVAKGSVSGHFGEVRVLPVTVPDGENASVVVWTSDWASDEGGVAEFCDPIYKAALADLKAHFG